MKQRWGQNRVAAWFWTFSSSFWRPTPEGSQTEPLYSKTGHTSSLYAASFTSCGTSVKISSQEADKPQCKHCWRVFHRKLFVVVSPIYLMHSTFSRTVPSRAWIFLIRFHVICIILHLTGWNLILSFLAQHPSWSISCWSFNVSSVSLIFRWQTQSSAKSLKQNQCLLRYY